MSKARSSSGALRGVRSNADHLARPVRRIIVIGGGISGLSAAHRLLELDPEVDVTVFESSSRAGGIIHTERTDDGFVIEHGPDAIISDKPWARDLAVRLGLEDQIISTSAGAHGAYVVHDGQLERIPGGFSLLAPARIRPFLRTKLVSSRGKARALLDVAIPARNKEGGSGTDDEALGPFVRRRLGRELFDNLVQPLAGGIYGADPDRLSLRATMPRFLDIEDSHRSLIVGLRKSAKAKEAKAAAGARYSLFFSFERGTGSLVDALSEKLAGRVRLAETVTQLDFSDDRVQVTTTAGSYKADGVILAVPAPVSASLLSPENSGLGQDLRSIEYGSSATVTLAYAKRQIARELDAYGFVVPATEDSPAMACTFSSRKWAGRAPPGFDLLRVFLGGHLRPNITLESDKQLVSWARETLGRLLGVNGDPHLTRVDRYHERMPQYLLGHLGRVAKIESQVAQLPRLGLAGNAYRGVGVPDSVHRAEQEAENLMTRLDHAAEK